MSDRDALSCVTRTVALMLICSVAVALAFAGVAAVATWIGV